MLCAKRRAKIVATLGPSCRSVDQIRQLVQCGADTLRVNTSHLTPEQAAELYKDIEAARELTDRNFGVLVDLQGPKLRLGRDVETREVYAGQIIHLAEQERGIDGAIPVAIQNFSSQVQPGQKVLLGDTVPQLRVQAITDQGVRCEVIRAGELRPRMGVTIPDGFKDLSALTSRDIEHLQVAAPHADWVALSFVRKARDIRLLREALSIRNCRARVIAKIERAEALDNLRKIVDVSDGVMVARGDLALEVGLANVPFMQEKIIKVASEQAKTVITATQVLESMITATAPTRAEAADIARALVEGTSALMLSAETATGDHPNLAVQTMGELIVQSEKNLTWEPRQIPDYDQARASLVHAADRLAADQKIGVILLPTDSGKTARMASALARQHLIALCPNSQVRRQLALERGVTAIEWDGTHGPYLPVSVLELVIERGLIKPSRRVAVVWNQTLPDHKHPVQLVAALQLHNGEKSKN